LVVEPSKRLNADQILKHPWVVGDVTPRKNLPSVALKIKEFNARRKFRRAQMMVIAANKFKNALKGI